MTTSEVEHLVADASGVIASDVAPEAVGCHGDKKALSNGAGGKANQALLAQYAEDYPLGPARLAVAATRLQHAR